MPPKKQQQPSKKTEQKKKERIIEVGEVRCKDDGSLLPMLIFRVVHFS